MLNRLYSTFFSSSSVPEVSQSVAPAVNQPMQETKESGNEAIPLDSSIQIHKCEMTGWVSSGSNETKNECYILMKPLRGDDVFPEGLSKDKMIELFFPPTTVDMALSLSNVTSAFYGIMLQTCGNIVGMGSIDNVSKDFFYNLGKTKSKLTNEALKGKYDIPKDARGSDPACLSDL